MTLYQVVVGPAVGSNIVQITRRTLFRKCFFLNALRQPFWMSKNTFDRISYHFRSIPQFLFVNVFSKWPPAAILDVRKSLLIACLAISDRYGTFFLKLLPICPPAVILDVRNSLSFAFLAISYRYGTFFVVEIFGKMAAGGHFVCPNHFLSHLWPFQIDTEL